MKSFTSAINRATNTTNSGSFSVTTSVSVIIPKPSDNNSRKVVMITNCDSVEILYIGVGFQPSSSDFTIKLNPASVINLDCTVIQDDVYGRGSGTLNCRVYEGG